MALADHEMSDAAFAQLVDEIDRVTADHDFIEVDEAEPRVVRETRRRRAHDHWRRSGASVEIIARGRPLRPIDFAERSRNPIRGPSERREESRGPTQSHEDWGSLTAGFLDRL